jgi:hypothetical protein
MKQRRSVHQTQWAAQFAVASELCKRGYQVALTLGNHPTIDLMVVSPSGRQFLIDVKGLYKPNFWQVTRKPDRSDLFYVFAFVPDDESNQFFIMSQRQVNEGIQANWDKYCERHGKPLSDAGSPDNTRPGVEWKDAAPFQDWKVLPK